jgi:hypothetical protein
MPTSAANRFRRLIAKVGDSSVEFVHFVSSIICKKKFAMKGKAFWVLLLPYFVSVLCKVNQDTVDQNVVVTQVERKIDIASHLVKTYTSITIENKGSSVVRTFLFAVDPTLQNRLSFISAVVSIVKNMRDLCILFRFCC